MQDRKYFFGHIGGWDAVREGMLGMEGGWGWRKVVVGGVHRKCKLGSWMSGCKGKLLRWKCSGS